VNKEVAWMEASGLTDEFHGFRMPAIAKSQLGQLDEAKRFFRATRGRALRRFTGSLRRLMLELRKRTLTAERYDERIQSFEQWSLRGTRVHDK
jgi:hypothetical protein